MPTTVRHDYWLHRDAATSHLQTITADLVYVSDPGGRRAITPTPNKCQEWVLIQRDHPNVRQEYHRAVHQLQVKDDA